MVLAPLRSAHPQVQCDGGRVDTRPLLVGEVGQERAQVVQGERDDARRHAVQEVDESGAVRVGMELAPPDRAYASLYVESACSVKVAFAAPRTPVSQSVVNSNC